jgi:hypothetical protein
MPNSIQVKEKLQQIIMNYSLLGVVSINELTKINYLSVCHQTNYDVTDKNKNVLKVWTYIITSITARPVGLAVILEIMSGY